MTKTPQLIERLRVRAEAPFDSFVVARLLNEAADALTTIRQEAIEEAWQPIETAPKDGTRIIVAKIGWCHSTLERLRQSLEETDLEPDDYRVFFATSAHFHEKRQYWTDGLERLVDPTHWIHLPNPPTPAIRNQIGASNE